MLQQERCEGEAVPVVMMTHTAAERELQAAVAQIDALDAITEKTLVVRVEDR